jgi:hypothetical protein
MDNFGYGKGIFAHQLVIMGMPFYGLSIDNSRYGYVFFNLSIDNFGYISCNLAHKLKIMGLPRVFLSYELKILCMWMNHNTWRFNSQA